MVAELVIFEPQNLELAIYDNDSALVQLSEQAREQTLALLSEDPPIQKIREARDVLRAVDVWLRPKMQTRELKVEARNNLTECILRLDRATGGVIQRLQDKGLLTSGKGGDRKSTDAMSVDNYKSAGITEKQASRWKMQAQLPDKEFEEAITEVKENGWELTSTDISKRAKEYVYKTAASSAVRTDNPSLSDNIRVLQGDMLDILPTLDERFDLVIADPPYNVTEWEWDKRGDNFLNETRQWLEACLAVCKPAYNLFWFCSPQFMADIELVMRELKMPIQSRIVWHRRNMALGSNAAYRFLDTYELIFHVGNRALNFPPVWGEARFDVQTFAAPQTNFGDTKMHPTQKPLDLIQRLVEFGSYPGDAVLDPFAGSGTTGAACSDTRSCVLIEKEDEYIHVISNRLAIIRE